MKKRKLREDCNTATGPTPSYSLPSANFSYATLTTLSYFQPSSATFSSATLCHCLSYSSCQYSSFRYSSYSTLSYSNYFTLSATLSYPTLNYSSYSILSYATLSYSIYSTFSYSIYSSYSLCSYASLTFTSSLYSTLSYSSYSTFTFCYSSYFNKCVKINLYGSIWQTHRKLSIFSFKASKTRFGSFLREIWKSSQTKPSFSRSWEVPLGF